MADLSNHESCGRDVSTQQSHVSDGVQLLLHARRPLLCAALLLGSYVCSQACAALQASSAPPGSARQWINNWQEGQQA